MVTTAYSWYWQESLWESIQNQHHLIVKFPFQWLASLVPYDLHKRKEDVVPKLKEERQELPRRCTGRKFLRQDPLRFQQCWRSRCRRHRGMAFLPVNQNQNKNWINSTEIVIENWNDFSWNIVWEQYVWTYQIPISERYYKSEWTSSKGFISEKWVTQGSLFLGFDNSVVSQSSKVLNVEGVVQRISEGCVQSFKEEGVLSLVGESNEEFHNLSSMEFYE